ncbi:hypothetical protein TWF281_010839 [Arthrobotrys megalospora]
MAAIFKKFERKLAGWGEVPYSVEVRRIREHEDVVSGGPKPAPKPNNENQGETLEEDKIRPGESKDDPTHKKPLWVSSPVYARFDDGNGSDQTEKGNLSSKLNPRNKFGRSVLTSLEHFEDMKKFTQPPGTDFKNLGNRYYYSADLGRGVTIYLIDTGVFIDHPVSLPTISLKS